ncbi:MAG: hypothetical protein KI788_06280 [Mameliella sp.]|nr:hypothetical protein [Mameliella sp.]
MSVLTVTEHTTFEEMRAAANSPHELLTMLDQPDASSQYGYWLEQITSLDSVTVLNVFAHGPDWVCIKPEGYKGDPYWARWENLDAVRVVAQ